MATRKDESLCPDGPNLAHMEKGSRKTDIKRDLCVLMDLPASHGRHQTLGEGRVNGIGGRKRKKKVKRGF